MKRLPTAVGIALLLVMPWDLAAARGCISGAAVGGVAGHVAGHHAVIGAVAGCAINHHRDKVKDRQARDAQAAADAREAQQRQSGNGAAVTNATPR